MNTTRAPASLEERIVEHLASRPGATEVRLNTLSQNVYTDIQALCERVEDLREDVDTALSSLMEHSAATGHADDESKRRDNVLADFLVEGDEANAAEVRNLNRRLTALAASYEGLLARCNTVEEQSKQRTRNLVTSVDGTDREVERLTRKVERLERGLRYQHEMRVEQYELILSRLARLDKAVPALRDHVDNTINELATHVERIRRAVVHDTPADILEAGDVL